MNSGLSIKDLENLSGIKAHTIRMWEKRYNIFEPQRTKTNIRFYDNDDLKKLLNITSILDNGMRISRACQLSQAEINKQILTIQAENIEASKSIVINELIIATLQCNGLAFENTFANYKDTHSFEATIEQILYPLLVRIGLMWTVSKLNPAQEHFAIQLIKQKLFAAINELPNLASKRKFLLYLPEKEDHEIGLLYAYYLIKKSGLQTIYLGPNVPLIDVISCADNSKPTDILCTFTVPRKEETLTTYLDEFVKKMGDKNLLIHTISNHIDEAHYQNKINFLTSLNHLKNLL
jgi:DNA-binding transcriptional MerR regulator